MVQKTLVLNVLFTDADGSMLGPVLGLLV